VWNNITNSFFTATLQLPEKL